MPRRARTDDSSRSEPFGFAESKVPKLLLHLLQNPGDFPFYRSFETIDIPKSVTHIVLSAFAGCVKRISPSEYSNPPEELIVNLNLLSRGTL